MRAIPRPSLGKDRGRALRALGVAAALAVVLGIFRAEAVADFLAYLIVLLVALAPALLWVRSGTPGIPVLPTFAALHIFYFALPILNSDEVLDGHSQAGIVQAAGTVSLFLAVATLASYWASRRRGTAQPVRADIFSERQMVTFLFVGLVIGATYHVTLISGGLSGLGTWFGLLRSIVSTALVVSCYFLGVARARGLLRKAPWALACAGLSFIVALSWSTLFLVGGAAYILAAALGYIITGKRIPWLAVILVFVVVNILHAGKAEMRAKYWEQGQSANRISSFVQLPEVAVEWFAAGLKELGSGAERRTALDRTSLLPLLLRAQQLTPQYVDYLRGETYALLPGMLVPRFLSPNKTKSQAGMDLLNIRYGFLTVEGVTSTAIGWGLVAEAWANFGYWGEVLVGLFVGALAGALTRWSAGASAVSRPTLLAIAAMIALLNLEADLAGLMTTLLQAFAAVFIFLGIFRIFAPQRRAQVGPGSPRPVTSRRPA